MVVLAFLVQKLWPKNKRLYIL